MIVSIADDGRAWVACSEEGFTMIRSKDGMWSSGVVGAEDAMENFSETSGEKREKLLNEARAAAKQV